MNPLALTSGPQELEIKVYPDTFSNSARSIVVEGVAKGCPVAIHLAFHPETRGEPVEIYCDEDQAFISGVLSPAQRAALMDDIVVREKITLTVCDPTISYAGGGRTSQVALKAPTDKPVGKAANK